MTVNPFSIAFFANKPAPIRTFGLDVFVQEVIAAMTISPSFSLKFSFSIFSSVYLDLPVFCLNTFLNASADSDNKTLSCGLFGPEIVDTILDKSSFKVSLKIKSLFDQRFCSLA